MKKNRLTTDEIELLDKSIPLNTYPRKDFTRNNEINLNGQWDYVISDNPNCRDYIGKILVPYAIESINSGVEKSLNVGEYIIYHRNFVLGKNQIKDKSFIEFFGIDQEFDVILNGVEFPHIVSLSLPIKLDVSEAIKEENDLVIVVKDDLDEYYPHGKQTKQSKGMWYTSVSGIYYSVFFSSVNKDTINSIKTKTNLNSISIDINSDSENFIIEIFSEGTLISSTSTNSKSITINIDNPILWELTNPHLYNLVIKTTNDEIHSYFGLRSTTLTKEGFFLNNKKVFINGLLDQGYYPEGIFTVSDYKSYEKDILTMKELGFNCLRKHIKIEDPYFYYLCDKYGMLVIQDFGFCGKYSFFHDTVLPTIGFQKLNDKNKNIPSLRMLCFYTHGEKLVNYLNNHPCVIGYTIFNEGWGQFNSDDFYNDFKKNDSEHFYDSTSGWFRQSNSDVESLHIYFKSLLKHKYTSEKPILISEFGGYVYKIDEHSINLDKTFGYRFFKNQKEFQEALIDLYETQVIPLKDKIVGTIYTQVSDVEDETNGLFTYDRKILKVDKDAISKVMSKLND